jgi:hypothetical protein
VEEITGGSPELIISGIDTDKPYKLEYGGVTVLDWDGNQSFDLDSEKKYLFRLSTFDQLGITLAVNHVEADIRITKIETNRLQSLKLLYFENALGDYLERKIRTWWTLVELQILTGTNPGMKMNRLLESLVAVSGAVGVLQVVTFNSSTPDARGDIMIAQLTTNGVLVTTA